MHDRFLTCAKIALVYEFGARSITGLPGSVA